MECIAVVTTEWWLVGDLEQWRRTTGVLRAHLCQVPLSTWMSPRDTERLVTMGETARHRDVSAVIALGYWQQRARALVGLSRWSPGGAACIHVRALEARPVSAWWVPWPTYVEYPPIPHR